MQGGMRAGRGNRSRFGVLAALLLVVIGFAPLYAFSANSLLAERGYRFDIYPRYVGAQAVWAGESPYAQAVTERIQMGMYGRVLPPDADQQRFAHPAYSAVLLAPLLLLPPDIALPLWMTLQIAALFATPFLWLFILGWKPRPLLTALLVIGMIFVFRYPVLSYVWGQFTGGIVFLVSLSVWLMQRRRDAWAGAALAFAAVPPSVSGPLALLLLGVWLLAGRWRAAAAFVAVLGAATLVSIALVGWWFPDFLAGLRAYAEYAHPVWAFDYLPGFTHPLLIGALVVAVLVSGWRAWCALRAMSGQGFMRQLPPDLLLFISISILACLLLLPQTGNYYLVLGVPILMICAWRARRQRRFRRGVTALLIVATIFSPWVWVIARLPDIETLVTPVLLGLTLGAASFSAARAPRGTATLEADAAHAAAGASARREASAGMS